MTFENFKNIIRNGEAKGEIKTSKPLTDFDLAVQWAIGNIGKRKGYPCDITIGEIWQEIYPIYEADAQEVADFLNGCTEHAKQADTPQTEDLLITEYPQKGEVNIVGNGSKTAVVMDYDEYKAMQTGCPWK